MGNIDSRCAPNSRSLAAPTSRAGGHSMMNQSNHHQMVLGHLHLGAATAPKGDELLSNDKRVFDFLLTDVNPSTIAADQKITLKGMGFYRSDEIAVQYKQGKTGEVEYDKDAQFVDNRTLLSTVPTFTGYSGPVELAVSLDAGATWVSFDSDVHYVTVKDEEEERRQLEEARERVRREREEDPKKRLVRLRLRELKENEDRVDTLYSATAFYETYFANMSQRVKETAQMILKALEAKLLLEEEDKERFMARILENSHPSIFKVRLILTDIPTAPGIHTDYGPDAASFPSWVVRAASHRGPVHTAVQIGPWILDWSTGSLIIPRPSIYDCAFFNPDALGETVLEMPRDRDIIIQICSICVDWNARKTFNPETRNYQHFVDEVLRAIPTWTSPKPGCAIDTFLAWLRAGKREYWAFTDAATGVVTEFPTHTDLDEFCADREVYLKQSAATSLGTEEDHRLLQAIDRMMWFRRYVHIRDEPGIAAIFAPATTISQNSGTVRCYFGPPYHGHNISQNED